MSNCDTLNKPKPTITSNVVLYKYNAELPKACDIIQYFLDEAYL